VMGKYQGYEKYKDSGVKWLGAIPEYWEQKRLRFAVNLINNKIDAESSDLSYMGLEHIESWTGKRIEDEKAFSEGVGSHFLPNDVLFGKLRPYLAKVYLSETEGLASTEALVLRCDNNIYPGFLKYYILSRDFINIVDSSTFGSKMPRASWDFIGNLFLTFPPLDEQESIAHFLARKTSQIDALIAKKAALLEKLDEKRTALISHAVTKGLDSSVPMKDSGVEWLGDIPEHWEIQRMKFIGDIKYGLGEPPEKLDDGLPIIRATDIFRGVIDGSKVQRVNPDKVPWSRNPELKTGDILVVRSGAYTGDSAIVTNEWAGSIAGYDMVFTPTRSYPKYIAWNLLSRHVLEGQLHLAKSRAAQPHLNAEELGNTIIAASSLNEQEIIAEYLDRKTAEIDRQKAKVKEAIDLLKEYRTALITNAVTGKIDVRQVARV
jgi:type I restriction enzyme, S subunit